MPRFGVSTHLFHDARLSREHLVHIAAHSFEAIELFATRSHFDYHDAAAIDELAAWLDDTRLELHSVHAPIVEGMRQGKWIGAYSNASADEARRDAALNETRAALEIARKIPYRYLVVHLGMPAEQLRSSNESSTGAGAGSSRTAENQLAAARRSLEAIVGMASDVGVKVAVEVIPNPLSDPESLVKLIEDDLEGLDAGICLDYGHAHLMGDLNDALETVSGHLWTTHVHDNGGIRDDHLVPYAGSIDWETAMMTTQKVGYDGIYMLEVADTGEPVEVLRRSVRARERLEKTFVTF